MKNSVKKILAGTFVIVIIFSFPLSKGSFGENNPVTGSAQQLEKIIQGVGKRYDVASFSATFFQESILTAMNITDIGKGRITVKRPWNMKWEYEEPEKQIYVTDGNNMWIYRPEDNQVQIGKAESFFTGVVRAVFLLDMKQIKKYFQISLVIREKSKFHVLKLLPKEKIADVSEIYLFISKKTYDVVKIIKYNTSEDQQTYMLSDFKFNQHYPDSIFRLKIPKGADVQYLDHE